MFNYTVFELAFFLMYNTISNKIKITKPNKVDNAPKRNSA